MPSQEEAVDPASARSLPLAPDAMLVARWILRKKQLSQMRRQQSFRAGEYRRFFIYSGESATFPSTGSARQDREAFLMTVLRMRRRLSCWTRCTARFDQGSSALVVMGERHHAIPYIHTGQWRG